MEPISIAATSLGIAAAVAKTCDVIYDFSRDFKEAADDLSAVTEQIKALDAILDPLKRHYSHASTSPLPEHLRKLLEPCLANCARGVTRIEDTVMKYHHDKTWSKLKWTQYGQKDLKKLTDSLETHMSILELGLNLII